MAKAKKTLGQELIEAVKEGNAEEVERLLAEGADIGSRDRSNNDYTPLMTAIVNNKFKIVEILLQVETDINAQEIYGYTSLMQAALFGYQEIVEMLLQCGADSKILNNESHNALDIANRFLSESKDEDKPKYNKIVSLLNDCSSLGNSIKKALKPQLVEKNLPQEEQHIQELGGEEADYGNSAWWWCGCFCGQDAF